MTDFRFGRICGEITETRVTRYFERRIPGTGYLTETPCRVLKGLQMVWKFRDLRQEITAHPTSHESAGLP